MSLAKFQLDNRSGNFCVVAGLGLLGGAIAQLLTRIATPVEFRQQNIDWTDASSVIAALDQMLVGETINKLELVWAAGRAGFSATRQEMEKEYQVYERVLFHLDKKFQSKLTVNLLSSAGGIYEAIGRVGSVDEIAPIRAYALSKLEQESFLIDRDFNHRIYRLSSVYGIGSSRVGLIQTLINNSVARQSLDVYADQNTLRDYIFNVDVARQITSDIIADVPNLVRIVATGRATSITMLLNTIQRITGLRPAASFRSDSSNSRDIVFAPSLLRGNLPTTSLEEGIRLLYKLTTSGSSHIYG